MGALCGRLCFCLCSLRGGGRRLLGALPFVGTFAFAFVPLEEGEEGFFLAVVRCDGFFWGDSSTLLSALGLCRDTLGIVQLCARAPVC